MDLGARLSVYDWVLLLINDNQGLPQWGVAPVRYNEALHGVCFECGPNYIDPATGLTNTGCPTRCAWVPLGSKGG